MFTERNTVHEGLRNKDTVCRSPLHDLCFVLPYQWRYVNTDDPVGVPHCSTGNTYTAGVSAERLCSTALNRHTQSIEVG